MKNVTDFLKKNAWQAATVILLLLFLGKGCTSNKISKLDSKFSESEARLEKR